jgi:quinoprotein glucose dehydrogenase
MRIRITILGIFLGLAAMPTVVLGQSGARGGEWAEYGGDLGSTKYSALDQINADNVDRVSVAWRWTSSDSALIEANSGLGGGAFKATPIMLDGVLYIRTSLSVVAAIDAATGEELWVFDPLSHEAGRLTNLGFNTRGVAQWSGPDETRIFVATGDAHLWALDSKTGTPVEGFDSEGSIDLIGGLRRDASVRSYSVMSPPIVVGDVIIVGSSINDGPRYMTAPPGDVRAFDVRTGEEVWNFHTVPLAGELGNDTWENDSWTYTGNTNVWTIMSADEELGLVYLPIGTPTNDWYGGHRLGDGLFGESLVAVEAATGERVWHFQFVHHGVWDYDLPAAPALLDINVDGRPIKAVAQLTKQGWVFVFDRLTGEPVWPIEERAVPPSTVPGERLSPTQPFPTRPAPFERQGISIDELTDFSPELRAQAEAILEDSDWGPIYTPPSLKGTINMPGWFGGANWSGGAFDPESGVFYIPSRTGPTRVQLVEGDSTRSDFRYLRGGNSSARGPELLPLVKPPYARITAIDLNTGDHVWQVPLGDGPRQRVIDMGIADPGPLGGGAFTGPLLTETLLFIGHGGARDGAPAGGAILALDKASGRTVHAIDLPAVPSGTPMTYMAGGRQYIVVAYGSGADSGLVAVALN